MHTSLTRTVMRTAIAPLLAAGSLAGIAPALAAAPACTAWTGVQPADPGGVSNENVIVGVAALSSCDAWAVGDYFNGTADQALIERWDGTIWTPAASPNPPGPAHLRGVAASSARNAWAVGYYFNGTNAQPLIEHWNGTTWKQVASPAPAGPAHDNILTGVAVTSGSNAWAVGFYVLNGTVARTLIEHWNGRSWQQVPGPNPSSSDNTLAGVTATSAGNAWTVGQYLNSSGNAARTLVEHWNGRTWKQVPSPSPSSVANGLSAVTAASADNAWAVGDYFNGVITQTLTEHWNGRTWQRVPSPNPGGSARINTLTGAAAISSSDAWAVGFYSNGTADQTLIEHWNGSGWKQVRVPDLGQPPAGSEFRAISASSAANAWAVGSYFNGTANQTLALHCC